VVDVVKWSDAPGWKHKSKIVGSPAAHASNFSTRIAKKINKALSVRVKVICSDHKLLWWDSQKGVGLTSTSPESILHKIIIIIISFSSFPTPNDLNFILEHLD